MLHLEENVVIDSETYVNPLNIGYDFLDLKYPDPILPLRKITENLYRVGQHDKPAGNQAVGSRIGVKLINHNRKIVGNHRLFHEPDRK